MQVLTEDQEKRSRGISNVSFNEAAEIYWPVKGTRKERTEAKLGNNPFAGTPQDRPQRQKPTSLLVYSCLSKKAFKSYSLGSEKWVEQWVG